MEWLILNWESCLSVVSALLSATITVLHMANKSHVAASLQELEDALSRMAKKPPMPPAS